MSNTFIYLTDVTVTNEVASIEINNAESVFGVEPFSLIFIDNDHIGVIHSVDDEANSILLTEIWPHITLQNVSALIVPYNSAQFTKNMQTRISDMMTKFNTLMADMKDFGVHPLITGSNVGASYTLSAGKKTVYDLTLTELDTSITCNLRTDTGYAHELLVLVRQQSGGQVVTWNNVTFINDDTLSTAAGEYDIIKLIVTNTLVLGQVVAKGLS